MKPWIDYRTKQGYNVRLISSKGTNEQIQKRIQEASSTKRPAAIVLVGDAAPAKATDAELLARSVPNFLVPAKVNVRYKGAPLTGTDNNYADLDGDRVPDVPIGRLPVDNPKELSQLIKKTIAYESTPIEAWRQDISLIAGVGGFGQMIDAAIDAAAWQLIRQIPDDYRVTMTQGSWSSPFCPPPNRFPETVMERMNDGPFFWVYIGHGHRAHLDRLNLPQCKRRIMTLKDIEKLRKGQSRTIALVLTCKAGTYDAKGDSLAEEMVTTPGGPVASLGASRATMPYAMATLADGMIRQLFVIQAPTLGEVCLHAKQEMTQEGSKEPTRAMLDQFAKTISPHREELDQERLEHIELFNLFGDPLLKIAYPEKIDLTVSKEVKPGEKLEISGTLPVSGPLVIELVRSRKRPDYAPARRKTFPKTPEGVAAMQEAYNAANRYYFHHVVEKYAKAGPIKFSISVPKDAPKGRCAVRIYTTGTQKSAAGSAGFEIL
jgi:hypothetical protein